MHAQRSVAHMLADALHAAWSTACQNPDLMLAHVAYTRQGAAEKGLGGLQEDLGRIDCGGAG